MSFLSEQTLILKATGKCILMGEHAAVYGFPALALSVPETGLTLRLISPKEAEEMSASGVLPKASPRDWYDAWRVFHRGKPLQSTLTIVKQLTVALENALTLCGLKGNDLASYTPQWICIETNIPLGGGMGGSAAISLCLLKLALKCAKLDYQAFPKSTLVDLTNRIDSLFHSGQASGLDSATLVYEGLIAFQKGTPPSNIQCKNEFWLALIDSEEKGETSVMIQRVQKLLEQFPTKTRNLLDSIGRLSETAKGCIQTGDIPHLAVCLNKAHTLLGDLNLSTPKIDSIIQMLLESGALAAKLTGAGGGGTVLGLFEKRPEHLLSLFSNNLICLTNVK